MLQDAGGCGLTAGSSLSCTAALRLTDSLADFLDNGMLYDDHLWIQFEVKLVNEKEKREIDSCKSAREWLASA